MEQNSYNYYMYIQLINQNYKIISAISFGMITLLYKNFASNKCALFEIRVKK